MGDYGMRLTREPAERVELAVGNHVRFIRDHDGPFEVRAISSDGRWVILTRPYDGPEASVIYTVLDFDSGVRGADNYGGLGYETDEQIAEALARFEAGDAEVSVRHDVYLDIAEVTS